MYAIGIYLSHNVQVYFWAADLGCIEQNVTWETDNSLIGLQFPRVLRSQIFQYRILKISLPERSLDPV
jgi:hypothetical protein